MKEFKRRTLLSKGNNELNDFNRNSITLTNFQTSTFNHLASREFTASSFKNTNPIISASNQKKKDMELDQMNLRISSATSSNCFRSTHYTMNTSSSKVLNSQNFSNSNNLISNLCTTSANYNNNLSKNLNSDEKNNNNNPSREIKSSFSTFRPKFDYSGLMIEKINFVAKQKEIAEKRNLEEIKECINEWGISKARYDEEIERKNDTKKMLRYYQKNLSLMKSTKNLNNDKGGNSNVVSPIPTITKSKENEEKPIFNSPFKPKPKNNFEDLVNFDDGEKNIEKNSNQIFLIHQDNNDDNCKIIDINDKNSNVELIQENANKDELTKTPTKSASIKENLQNIKTNTLNLQRIRGTKIKNLENSTNKLIDNKEIVIIDIKFKEEEISQKTKSIIEHMRTTMEKIPSDKVLLMKSHDKIFEARHMYGNLLNVKEIDNYKDGYKYHVTPLSFYDNLNLENFNNNHINNTYDNNNKKSCKMDLNKDRRPSTGYEFLKSHYNSNPDVNNQLNQRRSLTDFLSSNQFRNSCTRFKNLSFNFDKVRTAFSPPTDDQVYPKYYLPTPGFGLVVKAPDPYAKKGKKGGKASKKKK